MSPRARVLPAFVLVVSSLSCGPPPAELPQDIEAQARRFAEAVCEARTSCLCDDNRFESTAACEDTLFTSFVAAADDGMSFDRGCLDDLLASDAMTCAPWPWKLDYCRTLSRARGAGEPCGRYQDLLPAQAGDCAQGLLCEAGVCVDDPMFEFEIGEPCQEGDAQSCMSGAYCAADNMCRARGQLGDPCTDFDGCEVPQYCAGLGRDAVGTCTTRLELGEPCDPYDGDPCMFTSFSEPRPGCALVEGEYRCTDENPGICFITFPRYD